MWEPREKGKGAGKETANFTVAVCINAPLQEQGGVGGVSTAGCTGSQYLYVADTEVAERDLLWDQMSSFHLWVLQVEHQTWRG